MRIVASAVIALCLAGAAVAQEAPLAFRPTWEAEPSSAELVRHYPPRALQQGVSGIAVMCCMPRADGSVDCTMNSEWPTGHGFGEASIAASAGYRLSPESRTDLERRPGTPVRISLLWAAPGITQPATENLQRLDGESFYACMPPE